MQASERVAATGFRFVSWRRLDFKWLIIGACVAAVAYFALIPLIIPGILFTVAWILLGSPRIGIINLVLQGLFDTDMVFINVYSMWGMIWVDGLHYSPMAFLIMTAAFRSICSRSWPGRDSG
jgi:ABC-type Fe3+ transport system permease subunit